MAADLDDLALNARKLLKNCRHDKGSRESKIKKVVNKLLDCHAIVERSLRDIMALQANPGTDLVECIDNSFLAVLFCQCSAFIRQSPIQRYVHPYVL